MNLQSVVPAVVRENLRAWKARPGVREVALSDHPVVAAVGRALDGTLRGSHTEEEAQVIARIEARRAELLQSPGTISVLDYGAGRAGEQRSAEQMRQGVEVERPVRQIAGASKPAFWADTLFRLVRQLRPTSCLEMGTCVGISAAYQAAALRLNGSGKLVTLEGSPAIARIAGETLAGLGLTDVTIVTGPFHQTLAGALADGAPVDFLFNDGHHDRDAVLAYFAESLPYLAPDAVVVFDDISWSDGMRDAWRQIESHPRVAATVDLRGIGIAVLGDAGPKRQQFTIPL